MSKSSKLVLNYLIENIDLTNPNSLIDWIQEIDEAYETVPEEVLTAFGNLTTQELWEIIRKVAVEGKKQV